MSAKEESSGDLEAAVVPVSGLYIKQVSKILSVSPSVLRAWEKEGLVTPGRSPSGYRIYEAPDVDRLRYVRDLIQDEGLNPAAVHRILEADGARLGRAQTKNPDRAAGRLHMMRKSQNKSLRDLAAATGMSASAISAIERGASTPSVRSLERLAAALGTTVPLLLGTTPNPDIIVRPHDRQLLDLGIRGVRYMTLFATNTNMQSMVIEMEPGSGSSESYSHEGEEFLYVLHGELEVRLEQINVYRLSEGDAITYRSTRPHHLLNTGRGTTTVLWMNTPPSI